MPIHQESPEPPGLIRTVVSGRVTDDELLAYYAALLLHVLPRPWRELVDGTRVSDMALTHDGYARLAGLLASHLELLRGGRVAMVASNEVTYGMFRMWEMQREQLDYAVRVFRDGAQALAWLTEGLEGEQG